MGQHFTNQTTDGTSTPETWTGGTGTVFVRFAGREGSETVTMIATKYSADDDLADEKLQFRNNDTRNFTLGACDIKFELAGSGPATDLNAGIEAV